MARGPRASAGQNSFIDLNILPERYRPRKLSFRRTRPWLVAIGYALVLIPSFQLLAQASSVIGPLEREFRDTTAALADFREVSQEREALQAQYDELIRQASQIQTDYRSATIQTVPWGSTLKAIVGLTPGGVRLTSISQSADEVMLTGEADAYALPLDYADRLMQRGSFSDVIVDAIRRLPPSSATDPSNSQEGKDPGYEFEIRVVLGEAESR
jgi:Tfp pilus assembly protein PilN